MSDKAVDGHMEAEERLAERVRALEAKNKKLLGALFRLSYAQSLGEMREEFQDLWASIGEEGAER